MAQDQIGSSSVILFVLFSFRHAFRTVLLPSYCSYCSPSVVLFVLTTDANSVLIVSRLGKGT